MSLTKIREQISSLREELISLEKEYYSGNSTVEDEIYDHKLRSLISLENEYPEFKSGDSPSQRVGFYMEGETPKVDHEVPMLSLRNIFSGEELENFMSQCEKEYGSLTYFLEPKTDGVSISLIYKNKHLHRAISRGNGETGEDMTEKVLQIPNIPIYLRNIPDELTVRGEIYITKDDFLLIKDNLDGKKSFANHRNFVSGSLRLKNSREIGGKKLRVRIYQILHADSRHGINTQGEAIGKLRGWGFPTYGEDEVFLGETRGEIDKFIAKFQGLKDVSNVPCDGLVIKINEMRTWESLGYTSKFPRWAVAYKYPSIVKESKLIKIIPTVGRTGKITYSAQVEPTEINGSVIQFATLHNAHYIQSLDIRVGDYVSIFKSGEVIPKIISSRRGEDGNSAPWEPETNCPSCGSTLSREGNLITQRCTNENCREKRYSHLIHYCSRVGANIEGLSSSIIIKLHRLNRLKKISDIYKLKDHREEIINANIKIKEKLFDKLMESIEKSKDRKLYHLLAGLGIKHIGEEISNVLCQTFRSIDDLINVSREQLLTIDGLGPKGANELLAFFSDEENLREIGELKRLGLFKVSTGEVVGNFLTGKRVAVTGRLSVPRDEFMGTLRDRYGALISKSINRNTSYLIVGEDGGSKIDKALKLNINTLSEEEVRERLQWK